MKQIRHVARLRAPRHVLLCATSLLSLLPTSPLLYADTQIAIGMNGTKGEDATSPGGSGKPGTDGLPGNILVNNSDAQNFVSATGGFGGNGGKGGGNPTGQGGNGAAAGNAADGTASAQTSAPVGDVTQTVEANGGFGGAGGSGGDGHPGGGSSGDGGNAGNAKAFLTILKAGNVNVIANILSTGGEGGFGPQGGGLPKGESGGAGVGGNALASLFIGDTTGGTRTLNLTATGGLGGTGSSGNGGGDATINSNVTTAANIISIVNATGADGGAVDGLKPLPTGAFGGGADYTGTLVSTAGNITTTATLIGGKPVSGGTHNVDFLENATTNHGDLSVTADVRGTPETEGGSALAHGIYQVNGAANINITATNGPSTDPLVGPTNITLDAVSTGALNVTALAGGAGTTSNSAILTSGSTANVALAATAGKGKATLGATITSLSSVTLSQGRASSSIDTASATTALQAIGDVSGNTNVFAGTPKDLDSMTAANGVQPFLNATGVSTGPSGIVQVSGSATGGAGGFHLDGTAGRGADVSLNNNVSGSSHYYLTLSQKANGGDGGGTSTGSPGAAGHAFSRLDFDDKTATGGFIITSSAAGGQGGYADRSHTAAAGGNSEAFALATATAQIQQVSANAFGGRGGDAGGAGFFGGRGGDAFANAVLLNSIPTTTIPFSGTLFGRATGGDGGFADQPLRYGNGGTAESVSRAALDANSITITDVASGGMGLFPGSASSTAIGTATSPNSHDLTVSASAATHPLFPVNDSTALANAKGESLGTQATLSITAKAVTGPFGQPTAAASGKGAGGMATTIAQTGTIIGRLDTPIGSTVNLRTRLANSTAMPSLSDASSFTSYLDITTSPINSDSAAAFHNSPRALHDFDIGGVTNSVNLINLGLSYPLDGSGKPEEFSLTFTNPIDLAAFPQRQHLILALLDPAITGPFDQLRIAIAAGTLSSTTRTFTTPAEIANFFNDQSLNLGDLSNQTGILNLTINIYFDTHTPGSAFQSSMFLANTTPGIGPVPEPETLLLLLPAACTFLTRRRRHPR